MSKSSGYKNYKYKRFVEDIRDRPLKNKSAKEQYEEIYKFVQQESAKNEEDTYTFAKRYLSNTNDKYENVKDTVSSVCSVFLGLLTSFTYQQLENWFLDGNTNFITKLIVLSFTIVPLFIFFFFRFHKIVAKTMITRNIENDEIILTVLEDYCKEVEQTFRQKGETNE